MKKRCIFTGVVIFMLLLLGCDFGLVSLAPPDWIIGTWSDEFSINNWVFTADNAVFSASGLSVDFKEYGKTDGVYITDTSSATSYSIIDEEGGMTGTYDFQKITATTLYYSVTASGVTVGPILLTKT